MASDDDERYGEIIPPGKHGQVRRMYDGGRSLAEDARILPPGWGLANLIATLRHESAARLGHARAANVDAWTRFLRALNDLGSAMEDRERSRRRLENLDEILDAEEKYEKELTKLGRERNLAEARAALADANRRLALANHSLERLNEPPEPKERQKKPDPAERIRQGHAMRQRLREECDAMVNEIRAAARASGTESSPDVQREIENIQADFRRVIADTYEKG